MIKGGGGRAPYQKGARFERAIVRILEGIGLAAQRVPGSGSAGGLFTGDVTFKFPEGTVCGLAGPLRVEAKVRANGFRQIYGWLRNNFALIAKEDRNDPIIILKLRHAAAIVEALLGAQKRIAELEEERNGYGSAHADAGGRGRNTARA